MDIQVIESVLILFSGIGIFLIACSMLSDNLQAVSSGTLRRLFFKASNSKMLGVGIGAVGTAAIQSSGATSVMAIGFVNAGIMTLKQAATILYGASIGTTITGQIVALGLIAGESVSTSVIFSSLAGFGALLMLFAKSDKYKKLGGIIAGFGMLFVGLESMSSSMSVFAQKESVKTLIASVNNPFFLIVIGVVLTAIVQSSSVTSSIAITMLVSGLIDLDQGIYLVLGANIGTCSVAILSSLTGSANAKRTALILLMLKTFGVIVFVLLQFLISMLTPGVFTYAGILEKMFRGMPQTQLAMFHTLFNVFNVIVFLPFVDALVAVSMKVIKDKVIPEKHLKLYYLDYNLLKTPSIAARQVKNEVINMGKIALSNFNTALDIICTMDSSKLETFKANEDELDYLNREITRYVIELQKVDHSDYDIRYLASTFRSVADFERVGDYAENITEYEASLNSGNDKFSEDAIQEIETVRGYVNSLAEHVFKAYYYKDFYELDKANELEDMVDDYTNAMANNHIERLNKGTCTANAGAQYLSLAENVERVADHFINVGKSIRLYAK